MMEAVALAAEQAAVHGDIDIAVSLALTVAAALHDDFLTEDIRRTKVRDDSNVVYVPAFAPTTRKERFLEVYTKMKEEIEVRMNVLRSHRRPTRVLPQRTLELDCYEPLVQLVGWNQQLTQNCYGGLLTPMVLK